MKNKIYEIILVEDNVSDAELTIRALKKNGSMNSLLHLKDGEEALEYIFATGRYETRNIQDIPKVVFLDLKMPKIGGLEVLKRIKSNEITKMIPVVLLTSSKQDTDIAEACQLGANSYIVKPVGFEHFVKVISDAGRYWLKLNHAPK